METKEKIFMVQLLLEDIRDDWDKRAEERALKAKSLCEEIADEIDDSEFLILADYCDIYVSSSKRWGDWDGRFFKQPFPMGYERMDKYHNFKPTYNNKSKDFKSLVGELFIRPENRFRDWEV